MRKRLLDIIVAAAALLLLSPLMILIGVLVRFDLGSPILFCQLRPGRDTTAFRMIKFRTMRDAHDAAGRPLSDAERLTRFGRFLRATSLDELPELWNVLKGDMSLVGPRPLLMEYLPRYSMEQLRRHELRPGITGWAQVNGRNTLGWPEKLALDIWYVDHQTFWLDLKILVLTVLKVVARDGISAAGEATVTKFQGNEI